MARRQDPPWGCRPDALRLRSLVMRREFRFRAITPSRFRPILLLGLLLTLLTPLASQGGEPGDQAPGQQFRFDPASLPAPYATSSVANVAHLVDRPSPPPFHLPPGFTANAFATG